MHQTLNFRRVHVIHNLPGYGEDTRDYDGELTVNRQTLTSSLITSLNRKSLQTLQTDWQAVATACGSKFDI